MDFSSSSVLFCKNFSVLPHIDYKTIVRKFSVSVNETKIISIWKLNPNKAHGCDNISIRMLKICDTVIARPLNLICEKCIETERYPLLWKKPILCQYTRKVVAKA